MTRTVKDAIDTYQRIGNIRVQDTGPYSELARVLNAAYDQAAKGKGADRHSSGQRFEDQPIMAIQELVGPGFALGQAVKKVQESQRMDAQAAQRELLGAINYLAAAYLQRERSDEIPASKAAVQSRRDDMMDARSSVEPYFTRPGVPVSPEENEDIVGPGYNREKMPGRL